jgi:drug/metabolite transporter (DMT)-like permease
MTFRPARRPRGRAQFNRPYWLGVAAMLLVAGAANMTWVAGLKGTQFMDGRIALVMAVGGLVAAAFGSKLLGSRLTSSRRMLLSTICAVITVLTTSGDIGHGVTAGPWLALGGGCLWVFALIWEYNEGKRLNW